MRKFRLDKLKEECGVFGIYSLDGHDVSGLAYCSLFALQHRGQESAGIAVNNSGMIGSYKDMGLVSEVFDPSILSILQGQSAIGHVRYSTTGDSLKENAQPMVAKYKSGQVALAHNGNVTNARELRERMEEDGSLFQTTSDTEVILNLLARYRLKSNNVIDAIKLTAKELVGSYALTILTTNNLIGVRDPLGIRPLCLGKLDNSYVLASESCALDAIDAEYVRSIEPGEIIVINQKGMDSFFLDDIPEESHLCIFEHVYFARPDSIIDGASVYESRVEAGRRLAIEHPVEADVVIGVPDSGLAAAIGYADEAGILYGHGLLKNRYVARTFIQPGQGKRESSVSLKFNAMKAVVAGKRVVMIDDSIVRGTTMKKIINMLKKAGATEVHMRVSSPPIIHPCFYGVDISRREELIAASHTVDEIRDAIKADSLGYLSVEGLVKSPIKSKLDFCTACLNGEYPTELTYKLQSQAYCKVCKA